MAPTGLHVRGIPYSQGWAHVLQDFLSRVPVTLFALPALDDHVI